MNKPSARQNDKDCAVQPKVQIYSLRAPSGIVTQARNILLTLSTSVAVFSSTPATKSFVKGRFLATARIC